jgi:hypothetical protein
LLFSFLFRHGSSGRGNGRLPRTALLNMRAAKEWLERPGVLPSFFLWIIDSFPFAPKKSRRGTIL